MNLDTLSRNIVAAFLAAAALMLFALPSFAQDEDSDAAPAQQGGHYEARQDDGADEAEAAPAPIPQPAARARRV
ncbi:MAG: hypothetical protein PHS14_08430, partial [Elusimicrobia bacterium]|nr:hypothetical protein [Elusimicrobiota bacterium]